MKTAIAIVVVLSLIVVAPVSALQWKVTASVSARVIPRPDPQDANVTATGFHRLTITQLSVADSVLPIKFKINPGVIYENQQQSASCSTGWKWASSTLSTLCMTFAGTMPCQNAFWESSTLGNLTGHVAGGWKQSWSAPTFVDCECV